MPACKACGRWFAKIRDDEVLCDRCQTALGRLAGYAEVVVHCKNCIHYDMGVCSYGERKDGGADNGGVRRGEGDILPGGGADMSEFPERLRKLRERKRLKRYVLSERCGLNSDAIRRYELGTAKPTMDALKSIADEFGVSVDYLIGRTDYPCVVDIAEK